MITSAANASLSAARKLASRRERERTGHLLVEGPQALREARGRLDAVYLAESATEPAVAAADLAAAGGAPVRRVTDRAFAGVATTVHPQGVVGVARRPTAALGDLAGAGFVVVLDGVADPGNVGTAIRTADAAGADAVVCTAGSADPFGPKAVRASAGSVFHLPVVAPADPQDVAALAGDGLMLVALEPRAPVPLAAVDWPRRVALVFGGEAHGLSEPLRKACSVAAHVPIHGEDRPGYRGSAESLNLAASVAVVAYAVVAARRR